MRKDQSQLARLKIDNIDRVRPGRAGGFNAQEIFADGVEQRSCVIAPRDDDINLAVKRKCI